MSGNFDSSQFIRLMLCGACPEDEADTDRLSSTKLHRRQAMPWTNSHATATRNSQDKGVFWNSCCEVDVQQFKFQGNRVPLTESSAIACKPNCSHVRTPLGSTLVLLGTGSLASHDVASHVCFTMFWHWPGCLAAWVTDCQSKSASSLKSTLNSSVVVETKARSLKMAVNLVG